MTHGKRMKVFVLGSAILLLMNGCSKIISVGETKTYCQEHGADFSDDGVCLTPLEVFKNRYEIDKNNRDQLRFVKKQQGNRNGAN